MITLGLSSNTNSTVFTTGHISDLQGLYKSNHGGNYKKPLAISEQEDNNNGLSN